MSEQCGKRYGAGAGNGRLGRLVGRGALVLLASLFVVPQALALGLGQAQVQSYLQQPLVARIDLISRSEAEMATVTAGLASPSDFQVLGLTRGAIAIPLEFEIYRDLSDPHIRVTSRQPMEDPVVQLVVEVVWASGRMLRQYTLFLDPPTFDAPAPLPAPSAQRTTPSPGQAGIPQGDQPFAAVESAEIVAAPLPDDEPETRAPAMAESVFAAEPAAVEPPPPGPPFDPVASVPPAAEPEFSSSLDEPQLEDVTPPESANPVASEALAELPDETPFQEPPAEITEFSDQLAENVPAEARTTPTTPEAVAPTEVSEAASDLEPAAPAGELPVEVTEELPAEAPVQAFSEPVEEPSQPYRAALPDPFQPLPESLEVRSGDTLWSLSGAYAEAQATSVNQVMLAVQQKNPNAFVEGNINALKAGEILRMPSRDEVLAQDARKAMLEVLRQEALYRTRWDLPPSPDALPTLSNLADAAPGTSMSTEADLGTDEEALAERTSPPAPVELEVAEEKSVEEDSRLFLVPPSEDESQETQGMGQGGSGETGVSTGESVVEELARAREELANAQQEKAYLEDRLAELEAELARREVEEEAGLADTNLAEMEDRLRDDRLAGDEEPELAMPAEEDSWLSSFGPALAGLAVLAVVALVWFLRSRRDPEFTAGMEVPATGKKESAGDDGNDPAKSDKVESDDPEKLLDLARAYMAMGKRTQARDCIEAVTRLGTPAQVREARTMLAEL